MMGAVTISLEQIKQFQSCVNMGDDWFGFFRYRRYSRYYFEYETLGKTARMNKYKIDVPALMGLEQAKSYAKELHDQAFEALAFGDDAKELVDISQFLLAYKLII